MFLKTAIFYSDTIATLLSFSFNCTLLYLIQTKTNEELRPYSKILRSNSFVDMFFTLTIALSYFVKYFLREMVFLEAKH